MIVHMKIFLHVSICFKSKIPRKRLNILAVQIGNVFLYILLVVAVFQTLTIKSFYRFSKTENIDVVGYLLDNLAFVVHNKFYNILFHNPCFFNG